MMTINKSNVVLVIVVVAALAVASVVAAHGHGSPASALATTAIDNPAAAGLADTSAATSTSGAASAVDPAKQEPTLDQFKSRDPFIQTTSAPVADSTANPTSSPTAQPAPVSADVKIVKMTKENVPVDTYNYHNQKAGAALPSSGPVVEITKVAAGGVTFELLGNYTLGGESNLKTFGPVAPSTEPTQVQLDDGSVTLYYDITVMQLNYGEGSSSSSSNSSSSASSISTTESSSYAGHNIKALSIETSNGVPSATLVVDGTTYAARKVGAVISTSWGQVKILGINGPAQTVTVLHGDVQITLRVGQSVSK